MAFRPDTRSLGVRGASEASTFDAGLRAHMLSIYNWMTSGLLLTGIVSYLIAHTSLITAFYVVQQTPFGARLHPTPLAMLAMFAPLAFVMVLSFGINRLSKTTAQTLYWLFCIAMGASLTDIFLAYTGESIVRVFFITSGTFAAMSIFGYTTRTDLSRFGSFLIMGLIGIIIASVVNIFLHSTMVQFVVSVAGVLVFTGLTAYDTQRIKSTYIQFAYADGPDMAGKRAVYDALSLYLNFINLFMFILQLTGTRRSN